MTAPDRSCSPDSVPSASLNVGIDVSKASLEIALIGPEEEASAENVRASHTVPNTEDGFGRLLDWLEKQTDTGLENRPEQVHVCLEASGGYQRPVARFLDEHGLTVSVLNPQRTSAYADSQLNRSKTDRVDARLLARFCKKEDPSPWEPSSYEQKGLKEMTRGLEQLKKERDRLNNQIGQSENPTVTSSLESVLESVNESTGSKRQSTNISRAPTPLPRTETFWKRSPALAGRLLHSCSRSLEITSVLRALARRPPTPA